MTSLLLCAFMFLEGLTAFTESRSVHLDIWKWKSKLPMLSNNWTYQPLLLWQARSIQASMSATDGNINIHTMRISGCSIWTAAWQLWGPNNHFMLKIYSASKIHTYRSHAIPWSTLRNENSLIKSQPTQNFDEDSQFKYPTPYCHITVNSVLYKFMTPLSVWLYFDCPLHCICQHQKAYRWHWLQVLLYCMPLNLSCLLFCPSCPGLSGHRHLYIPMPILHDLMKWKCQFALLKPQHMTV